ncbi:hypothetical protein ACFSC3_03825 [Sphingomonas floccifaciens]|uniref:DUF4908 domain-containing protein n=1 Tax=Sphingomonas floccifaciens TaxID=1844115 RepID=A0ABW4NA39_9SPHN
MPHRSTIAALTGLCVTLLSACNDTDAPKNGTEPAASRRIAPAQTPAPTPTKPDVGLTLATPSVRADGAAAFVSDSGGWTPILYLCDAVDASRVIAVSRSELWVFAKPGLDVTRQTITIGREDPGAGSIARDLLRDGVAVGGVRSINPAMLGPAPATTLPTLSSVRIGERDSRCRWLPRARLLIVMPKRSAIVTQEADGSLTYRSFDFDKPGTISDGGERGTSSTPTVEVRGGRHVSAPAGAESYQFAAAPWTYRVTASARAAEPGASVTVLKAGREVSRSEAIAYEMAAARID